MMKVMGSEFPHSKAHQECVGNPMLWLKVWCLGFGASKKLLKPLNLWGFRKET